MRITQFTDYSLRVLLYLGTKNDIATVAEITRAFKISNNHLVKVVHRLSREGYVLSQRGKNGGIRLALSPEQIRIGDFVAKFEPMDLLECFNENTNTCPIRGACQLERSLFEAQKDFIHSLNRFTLAAYLEPGPMKSARMKLLCLGEPAIKKPA